jgi:hypothetical protein
MNKVIMKTNQSAIDVLDEFQKGDEQEQKDTLKAIEHLTKHTDLRWMRCTLESDDFTIRFSDSEEDWSENEFLIGTPTRILLENIRKQMEEIMIWHDKSNIKPCMSCDVECPDYLDCNKEKKSV